MTALTSLIKDMILTSGPIDIGTFMGMALTHPEYGYYTGRDPLGRGGDFTTAPEISQMFGELIGAWIVDCWTKLGSPSVFQLLECGPGRGTLMADALRVTASVPGFHDALSLVLLEASPVLRGKQKKVLATYDPIDPIWCETLEDPVLQQGGGPLVVIGNEFLDALPIRQLVFNNGAWKERMVTVDEDGNLNFVVAPIPAEIPVPVEGQEAAIYEISPERDHFVKETCEIMKKRGGAALFIDYGHTAHEAGDTLQAVRKHEYVPVLSDIGEADLTSHVNFAAIEDIACGAGLKVFGPVEQGEFLYRLGIGMRAEALLRQAGEAQKEDILKGLHRLTSADQMGKLFKVMGIIADRNISLGGF